MNNEYSIIKGKIDSKLDDAFKKILNKKNITQQDFIEKQVRDFVLRNLDILLPKEDDRK
ncbi:MAG: hypothetical protein ACI4U0_00440 [Candidatus Aphodocola sp.]